MISKFRDYSKNLHLLPRTLTSNIETRRKRIYNKYGEQAKLEFILLRMVTKATLHLHPTNIHLCEL